MWGNIIRLLESLSAVVPNLGSMYPLGSTDVLRSMGGVHRMTIGGPRLKKVGNRYHSVFSWCKLMPTRYSVVIACSLESQCKVIPSSPVIPIQLLTNADSEIAVFALGKLIILSVASGNLQDISLVCPFYLKNRLRFGFKYF